MNLSQANINGGEGGRMERQFHRKQIYEVEFCYSVLIKAPGKRLNKKKTLIPAKF